MLSNLILISKDEQQETQGISSLRVVPTGSMTLFTNVFNIIIIPQKFYLNTHFYHLFSQIFEIYLIKGLPIGLKNKKQ